MNTISSFAGGITEDTWIMTDQGPRCVKDLCDKAFTAFVNGKECIASHFISAGMNPVYVLETRSGLCVRLGGSQRVAVPDHRQYVAVNELRPDDEIILTRQVPQKSWKGKGSYEQGQKCAREIFAINYLFDNDYNEIHFENDACQLFEYIEDFKTSSVFQRGFVNGAVRNTVPSQDHLLCITHGCKRLLKILQKIMHHFGVISEIRPKILKMPEAQNTMCGKRIMGSQVIYELVVLENSFIDFIFAFSSQSITLNVNDFYAFFGRSTDNQFTPTSFIERIVPDGEELTFSCKVAEKRSYDANGILLYE